MTASVHYFAYGSNMSTATFRGRRGIEFRSATAARARGYRLVLDKPPLVSVGYSYANLRVDAGAEVWGVVYEITHDDLAHIDLTEGVLIENYRRVEIEVEPRSGERLAVFTLISDRSVDHLLPSTRYMSLLAAGALEHGLPAEYVAWLKTIPAASENAEAEAWLPVLDDAFRRR